MFSKYQKMNKKFILAAAGLFVGFLSFASSVAFDLSGTTRASSQVFQPENDFLRLKGFNHEITPVMTDIPSRADTPLVITEVEGETKNYTKLCVGTYFYDEVISYSDEVGAKIVWGDDNEVYFYNIFSNLNTNSYIKGTLEGDKITVNLPQTLSYYEAYVYGFEIVAVKKAFYVENNQWQINYEVDPTIQSFTFTKDESGVITYDGIGGEFDGESYPDYGIGVIYSDDKAWIGLADFYQKYSPVDVEINQLPEDIEMQTYSLILNTEGYDIKVGFDGKEVYLQGMAKLMPEGIVVGSLDDDNILTIPQNQVTGFFSPYYIYTKVVYLNPDYEEGNDASPYYLLAPEEVTYRLKYDEDSKSFSAVDSDIFLCMNANLEYVFALQLLSNPYIVYQEGYEGTPASPYGLELNERSADVYGYNSFYFYIPVFSTEKTLLLPENLFYRVYVDGKLIEFKETDGLDLMGIPVTMYMGVSTPTTSLPLSLDNQWDIVKWSDNMHEIGLYQENISSLGVETVYEYNGNTTVSERVTIDCSSSAVNDLVSDEIAGKEYFTLDGLKVSSPTKGILLERTTYSDGHVTTKKIMKQ